MHQRGYSQFGIAEGDVICGRILRVKFSGREGGVRDAQYAQDRTVRFGQQKVGVLLAS